MPAAHDEDGHLEEVLRKQRELMDLYRQAQKRSPEKYCKSLFKGLREDLDSQVGQVARELARHRMERRLGHPLDHEH